MKKSIEEKSPTPRELGFHFPAEFEHQDAIWLSWPHNVRSWPDPKDRKSKKELNKIFPAYSKFVATIAKDQQVHINVNNYDMKQEVLGHLAWHDTNLANIIFHTHHTNDAWCRDHGPAFVINRETKEKAIVDWDYNAWGGKYPHYYDNKIPGHIAKVLGLKVFKPGIIMEGGAVDFNGRGTLITTEACLLNKNRNPKLSWLEIGRFLEDYYGVRNVIWLKDGIVGDDTDGHIDDITRFVDAETVVTVIEDSKDDANYIPLQENLKILKRAKLENGKSLNIVKLPMPKPTIYHDQRLPASYANFLITNKSVIVPTFQDQKNDDRACEVLGACFPTRKIVPIDASALIWGLGTFHCLSQQEPAV